MFLLFTSTSSGDESQKPSTSSTSLSTYFSFEVQVNCELLAVAAVFVVLFVVLVVDIVLLVACVLCDDFAFDEFQLEDSTGLVSLPLA